MKNLKNLFFSHDDFFCIAEIGHNHQGDLETAKEMIKVAKECGASAIKFQKRDNKSLFTSEMYNKSYDNENSYGKTYGEHREFLEFNRSQYIELMHFAKKHNIIMFSTAFDKQSVDFLEDIGNPIYKVASADLDNIPLLEYILSTGKPIIVSTGGAVLEQVKEAYDVIKNAHYPPVLMQCTCMYPLEYEKANLSVLKEYKELFPQAILGYSGHDSGILLPSIAYMLGARVFEKHFTLNRALKGTDHKFSLEPQGLKKLVRDLKRIKMSLGDGHKCMYEEEKTPRSKMAKSLYSNGNLAKGTVLTESLISVKSPAADGISPARLNQIIGRKLKCEVKDEQILKNELFENA